MDRRTPLPRRAKARARRTVARATAQRPALDRGLQRRLGDRIAHLYAPPAEGGGWIAGRLQDAPRLHAQFAAYYDARAAAPGARLQGRRQWRFNMADHQQAQARQADYVAPSDIQAGHLQFRALAQGGQRARQPHLGRLLRGAVAREVQERARELFEIADMHDENPGARLLQRMFRLTEPLRLVNVNELWAAIVANVLNMLEQEAGLTPRQHLERTLTLQIQLISVEVGRGEQMSPIRNLPAVTVRSSSVLSIAVFERLVETLAQAYESPAGSDEEARALDYQFVNLLLLVHSDARGGALPERWAALVRPPKPSEVSLELGGLVCLLKEPRLPELCLLEACHRFDPTVEVQTLAEQVGEGPLSYQVLEPLIERLKLPWRCYVYTLSAINKRAKVVYSAGELNAPIKIHILHFDGHFFPVVGQAQSFRCTYCGRVSRRRHQCNAARRSYYQTRVCHSKTVEGRSLRPISEVEWQDLANDAGKVYAFYDLETAEFEGSNLFEVYNCGVLFKWKRTDGELESYYLSWYGPDHDRILSYFMSEVIRLAERHRTQVILVSHNGARFDAFFLMRWYMEHANELATLMTLLENGEVAEEQTTQGWPPLCGFEPYGVGFTGGAFKTFQAKDNDGCGFVHRDMCMHLPMSLDALSKAFLGVGEGKLKFPHNFLKGKPAQEVLAYVGPRPPAAMWGDGVTEEELDEAGISREGFNLAEWSDVYLRRDVETMAKIYEIYATRVSEMYGCPRSMWGLVSSTITLPQLTYRAWQHFLTTQRPEILSNIHLPQGEEYDLIWRAMYAGRCYPSILHHEVAETQPGWLQLDIKSMYPSAMMGDQYPLGIPRPLGEYERIRLNELLASTPVGALTDAMLPLGVFLCDVWPNEALPEPVLPLRDTDGGLLWSNEYRQQALYTVDMVTAHAGGYRINISGRGSSMVWPERGAPFVGFIDEFFRRKQEAEDNGDEVGRSLNKLIPNSLYGKLMQRRDHENLFAVPVDKAAEFLEEILATGQWDWTKSNAGKSLLFFGLQPNMNLVQNRYPLQLGVAVLAYSRRIYFNMLTAMSPDFVLACEQRIPMRRPLMGYTDTDSFLVPPDCWKRVQERRLNQSKLGSGDWANVSKELGETKAVRRWVAPAPKTYVMEVEDEVTGKKEWKVRLKGIRFRKNNGRADPQESEELYNHLKACLVQALPGDTTIDGKEKEMEVFKRWGWNVPATRRGEEGGDGAMPASTTAFGIHTMILKRKIKNLYHDRCRPPPEDAVEFPYWTIPRVSSDAPPAAAAASVDPPVAFSLDQRSRFLQQFGYLPATAARVQPVPQG